MFMVKDDYSCTGSYSFDIDKMGFPLYLFYKFFG